MKIEELFKKYEHLYLEDQELSDSPIKRRDLRAFLLLDKLVPDKMDMVCSAEHDEIWLQVTPEDLEGKATEAEVIELIRCGIRCDEGMLCMFV